MSNRRVILAMSRYNDVLHAVIDRRIDGRVSFKKDLTFGSITVRQVSLYFRPSVHLVSQGAAP